MQRINNPPSNLFIDGNPATGTVGTRLMAAWLNAMQEEMAAVVEAAGLELDEEDNGQLLAALALIVAGLTQPKVKAHGTTSGSVVFDLNDGDLHVIELDGDLAYSFANWPASGVVGALTLLIITNGYNVTHPTDDIVTDQTTISVTGTNAFNDSANGFSPTPQVGDMVVSSGFTDSENNGTFRVVSADTGQIVVDATLVNASEGDSVTIARKVVVWQGGDAPDLSAEGEHTIEYLTINGGTKVRGYLSGEDMR